MIGGKDEHHYILMARCRRKASGGDRRAGVTAHRLQQDVCVYGNFRKLGLEKRAMKMAADNDRPRIEHHRTAAKNGLLKQAMRAAKAQELLGPGAARERP
jgi:hypothetical protein